MDNQAAESEQAMGMSTDLSQLFAQMVALPFSVFIFGLEVIIKAVQGMQEIAGQSRTLVSGDSSPAAAPISESTISDASVSAGAELQTSTTTKERYQMTDQDLSGADTLKLVRYKIAFVKRDYEVVFPEKEDIVSYDTTGPAWAALKISEFMGSLGRIHRPEKWMQYPAGACEEGCVTVYPPGAPKDQHTINYIPECDRKYIQIFFEVLQRWQREPADYDKQQVEVLRGICTEISGIRAKM